MNHALRPLQDLGVLRPIDRHLGEALARLAPDSGTLVALAAAFASRALADGDTCLDLHRRVAQPLLDPAGDPVDGFRWPEAGAWTAALADCPLTQPGGPLVLRGSRLWLARYHLHERHLAEGLTRVAIQPLPAVDEARLDASVRRLFEGFENEAQEGAVRAAVARGLTVLAGGPGTGKTTTVVRLLAALAEQAEGRGEALPRVLLLAPTGKAAARLSESMRAQVGKLAVSSEAVREALPVVARTVHRALGPRGGRLTDVRFDASRPWSADVVVVDEASMVDLPLMARLVDAVKPGARLVLVGDPDQLAAVGAGAVLADLCGSEPPPGPVGKGVVHLVGSRRFQDDSAVGALARGLLAGRAEGVDAALAMGDDVALVEGPARLGSHPAFLAEVVRAYTPLCRATTPADRLEALGRFRVLAALRVGRRGVEHLNDAIVGALARAGLLHPRGAVYTGRPVLITANDYGVGLFNGDVGVLAPNAEGEIRAWFPTADPEAPPREVAPARLPPHETVFATTVHKSQGSEFDRVALVLPERSSPVLTRELVYTAVTRARHGVRIHGARGVLDSAMAHTTERLSGLREALAEADPG